MGKNRFLSLFLVRYVDLTLQSLNPPITSVDLIMVQRILIVDDEHDFIELLQYKLAGHGYELIVANDGVHALSQARTLKPNLILLDILLPDLDGLSVCEILRRQPATKKIPIIFMS